LSRWPAASRPCDLRRYASSRILAGLRGCQAGTGPQAVSLDIDQAGIAATIAGVAARRKLPTRAVTIAYAAALQESQLQNLDFGDRDSVGVFQQRPSQGWGTTLEIENPVYATTRFFAALVHVHNYTRMPVANAAQDVQHSADGAAYGQWTAMAAELAGYFTGSSPHGQGHNTAWAMLVQDELGIPMDQVTVIHGDTDLVPVGVGTYASRSLQLGGSAVYKAAAEVKDEARHQAADMLEAAQADVVLDTMTGLWQVRGDPDTALSWAQVAGHTSGGSLIADVSFTADLPTFPFGAHVSVVEVDTETGKVTLLRHVTVDDAGPVLNPVLAEGQRHGGIAQGAAQALLEEVLYDADGNPLTSTLADYAAITAAELPSYELLTSETPTTMNPLGVKGIGEAGTIGATPAIQNAVIDAVSHLGIRHIDMPATPQRVWTAINEATKVNSQ